MKSNVKLVVFVISVAMFQGCQSSSNSSQKNPPEADVENVVRAILPPFLTISEFKTQEPIKNPDSSLKINFKAVVTPTEDLYQIDREMQGDPRVVLLKAVQKIKTESALYGTLEATLCVDKWNFTTPQIQSGLEQFGKPKGAFPPNYYVSGSLEAKETLRQQQTNAQAKEQAKQAALAKQEQERKEHQIQLAEEEKDRQTREEERQAAAEKQREILAAQHRKEEAERKEAQAAERQKLLTATMQGSHYSGTVRTSDNDFMPITIVFGEQSEEESIVHAQIFRTDNHKWWRNFVGELHFEPDSDYPIILVPADADEEREMRNRTSGINCNALEAVYVSQWNSGNAMRLRMSDDNMEGVVEIPGGILGVPHPMSVHLKKGSGSVSAVKPELPKATTASKVATKRK